MTFKIHRTISICATFALAAACSSADPNDGVEEQVLQLKHSPSATGKKPGGHHASQQRHGSHRGHGAHHGRPHHGGDGDDGDDGEGSSDEDSGETGAGGSSSGTGTGAPGASTGSTTTGSSAGAGSGGAGSSDPGGSYGGDFGYGGAGAYEPGVCGDAIWDWNESCDDGNTTDGDGCDSSCSVEVGWVCDFDGSCREARCGDGVQDSYVVSGGDDAAGGDAGMQAAGGSFGVGGAPSSGYLTYVWESCDDGNTESGDGCDATCAIEPGYVCRQAGTACYPGACGDGKQDSYDVPGSSPSVGFAGAASMGGAGGSVAEPDMAGGAGGESSGGAGSYLWVWESCDDGNTESGDGCDAACSIESGWSCGAEGASCSPIVCGDGLIDWSEDCDDGNGESGDGCSESCFIEPGWICLWGGECHQPTCGDGILDEYFYVGDSGGNSSAGAAGMGMGGAGGGGTATGSGGGVASGGSFAGSAGAAGDPDSWLLEECDDGNVVDGDGCSSTCRFE